MADFVSAGSRCEQLAAAIAPTSSKRWARPPPPPPPGREGPRWRAWGTCCSWRDPIKDAAGRRQLLAGPGVGTCLVDTVFPSQAVTTSAAELIRQPQIPETGLFGGSCVSVRWFVRLEKAL